MMAARHLSAQVLRGRENVEGLILAMRMDTYHILHGTLTPVSRQPQSTPPDSTTSSTSLTSTSPHTPTEKNDDMNMGSTSDRIRRRKNRVPESIPDSHGHPEHHYHS